MSCGNCSCKCYKVELWEYEMGWGSKCFDVQKYKTESEALAKIEEVNSKNTASEAPDYYIMAKKAW